jgi:hypothetical protein
MARRHQNQLTTHTNTQKGRLIADIRGKCSQLGFQSLKQHVLRQICVVADMGITVMKVCLPFRVGVEGFEDERLLDMARLSRRRRHLWSNQPATCDGLSKSNAYSLIGPTPGRWQSGNSGLFDSWCTIYFVGDDHRNVRR